MVIDYTYCTDDDFDTILQKLVVRDAAILLSISGVYEALSEHYNNEVLTIWEQQFPEEDE